MIASNIFFANVLLLLNTISVVDAKIGKWNKAEVF